VGLRTVHTVPAAGFVVPMIGQRVSSTLVTCRWRIANRAANTPEQNPSLGRSSQGQNPYRQCFSVGQRRRWHPINRHLARYELAPDLASIAGHAAIGV
jgi:hypothetical protein